MVGDGGARPRRERSPPGAGDAESRSRSSARCSGRPSPTRRSAWRSSMPRARIVIANDSLSPGDRPLDRGAGPAHRSRRSWSRRTASSKPTSAAASLDGEVSSFQASVRLLRADESPVWVSLAASRRRRGSPGDAHLSVPGHLRAARARGTAAVPGRPRPAHGPVQPPSLRAGAHQSGPAPSPVRRGRSGADDRPRRLQGGQRPVRPRRRRRAAARAEREPAAAQPRDRRAGAAGRRRVRDPPAGGGSRRRSTSSPRRSSASSSGRCPSWPMNRRA